MTQWIKIYINIFDNEKIIKLFESRNGSSVFTNYIRLLCLAGKLNTNGVFKGENGEKIGDEFLAKLLKINKRSLMSTLKELTRFNLLKINENGEYYFHNWEYYQNGDALRQLRERELRLRARAHAKGQKLSKSNCDKTMNYARTEEEQEKEKEKESDVHLSEDRCTCDSSSSDTNERKFLDIIGKIGHDRVTLTNEQFNDLLDRIPLEMLDDYFDRLGAYLEKKDRYSNSCYRTILSWYKKDTELIK